MGPLDSELEDLYRRRHGVFQVMLASVTGSVDRARDAVQEAFVQALRDQDGFRGGRSRGGMADRAPGCGWVEGVARISVDEVPEVAFVDESSDPTLATAVLKLPPQRRMAIFLRYYADPSYAEIAKCSGSQKERSRRPYPRRKSSFAPSFRPTR